MNVIYIVGPGGAGKSTGGLALARRLGTAFVDLDRAFTARAGDISAYLAAHGYDAYAAQNVQVCLDTIAVLEAKTVVALSSGFMTYRDDVHPALPARKFETAAPVESVVESLVSYLSVSG